MGYQQKELPFYFSLLRNIEDNKYLSLLNGQEDFMELLELLEVDQEL